MIDFRYHVVSLVAVLLALATGILVGSSVLNGPLYRAVKSQTDQLRAQRNDLQDQVSGLQRDLGFDAAFANEVAPQLVAGRLTGGRVLIVTLPGAQDSVVNGVEQSINQAGGKVTGRVGITDAYTDTAKEPVLDDLASRLASQMPGIQISGDGSTYTRAAQLIASIAGTRDVIEAGAAPSATNAIGLPGLKAGGFLTLRGEPANKATYVVIVAGNPTQKSQGTSARSNEAYLVLADELDARTMGVVVVGTDDAAKSGGLISALRSDSARTKHLSSVDVADNPFGRVSTIWALQAEAAGKSGQYGESGTTDGPLPSSIQTGP